MFWQYLLGGEEGGEKRLYSACALVQGFKLCQGDEQMISYHLWNIQSEWYAQCQTVTEERELHFSRQYPGVLMMRSSIFPEQPVPILQKIRQLYQDMPFSPYITKFQFLAQENKNHPYFTIIGQLIPHWKCPFLKKLDDKRFF